MPRPQVGKPMVPQCRGPIGDAGLWFHAMVAPRCAFGAWTTRPTTGWTRRPALYFDTTGCGNALNAGDPVTLQLIMDSLRYWLTEMHVDGFRFDLAPTLARQDGDFEQAFGLLGPVSPRTRWCPGPS